MPLHHYIAATFLANFSRDQNPRRRKRVLWAVDKRAGRIFATTAERICGIHDFYTVRSSGWPEDAIDRSLSGFEPTLHLALQELSKRTLDAATWAGTLVPFVTSLLTRGPDFNERYEDRLEKNILAYQAILAPGGCETIQMDRECLSSNDYGCRCSARNGMYSK